MDDFKKRPDENEYCYIWRIQQMIDSGEIENWKAISPMVNRECREDESDYRDESAYRKRAKDYKDFYEFILPTINSSGQIKTRILCLSDFHVPFHLPISTFEKYIGKVDILVLNGDIVDMQGISKFPKMYRVSPMEELITGRQYLIDLIEYIHPKRVVINYGNHEVRWSAYFSKNLDPDMLELMPDTAIDLLIDDGFYHYDKRQRTKVWYEPIKNVFEDIDVKYTQNWWVKIGKTIFAHPLAYSSGMLKTTDKAVDYFYRVEKDFDCVILGHTHKLGSFIQGGVSLYEQGACCYTEKMNYTDGRLTYPQQKGYMYLCQDADGALIQQNTKLEVIN